MKAEIPIARPHVRARPPSLHGDTTKYPASRVARTPLARRPTIPMTTPKRLPRLERHGGPTGPSRARAGLLPLRRTGWGVDTRRRSNSFGTGWDRAAGRSVYNRRATTARGRRRRRPPRSAPLCPLKRRRSDVYGWCACHVHEDHVSGNAYSANGAITDSGGSSTSARRLATRNARLAERLDRRRPRRLSVACGWHVEVAHRACRSRRRQPRRVASLGAAERGPPPTSM